MKPNGDTAQSPAEKIANGNTVPSAAVFIETPELLTRVPMCRKTLWKWRKNGIIPYVQAGGKILFHWPSVEAALVRRQRGA